MKNSRKITELAKQIVDKKIGMCGCQPKRDIPGPHPVPNNYKHGVLHVVPCPTCADLRALRDELCWHEWIDYINPNNVPVGRECIHCQTHTMFIPELPANPTYTIQSLRKLLERMGEWWQIRQHIKNTLLQCLCHIELVSNDWLGLHFDDMYDDIITLNDLLQQAVNEYFEGIING